MGSDILARSQGPFSDNQGVLIPLRAIYWQLFQSVIATELFIVLGFIFQQKYIHIYPHMHAHAHTCKYICVYF